MIPAQAVEAAKAIYSDGWDGAPYWESMADDNSDKVHHRAIAQHALEAAAPHMQTTGGEQMREQVIRVFTTDRAWVPVVNRDWDPQQIPEYTPNETPIRPGYVRRFND